MAVTAPFQFARIPRAVWFPEWGNLVSHDVPFKDGYSGTIDIEVEAMTPLLIGEPRREATKEKEGEVWPVRLPDGTYAIPGSSLQGMIRNILEIACFGKLGPWVDQRRFGIRDISGNATGKVTYQSRMLKSTGHSPINVQPLVKAGWLRKHGGKYEFKSCEFARIEFADLAAISNTQLHQWTRGSDAKARYGMLSAANVSQSPFVENATANPTHGHRKKDGVLSLSIAYSKALRTAQAGRAQQAGKIVLSGNTGSKNPAKHMEFFFYNEQAPVELEPNFSDRFKEFKEIHEPDDGRPKNPNWAYYRDSGYPGETSFKNGGWMPIFYLGDTAHPLRIESFGLAFMFKLAHENDTHDMLKNSNSDHCSEYNPNIDGSGKFDLSSLIFGAVEGQKKQWFKHSLKRRASFETAVAVRPESPDSTREGSAVLLGPKPSYFPIYVRQPFSGDKLPATPADYRGKATTPYAVYDGVQELAGSKIWPVHGAVQIATPTDPNKAVQVYLNALDAGTTFKTKLHVHNLRKAEIGALIWALTFGEQESGNDNFWHRIGMGKPFQWGAIKIRIGEFANLIPNAPGNDDDFMAAFKRQIQEFCKDKLETDWDKTPQYAAVKKASQKSLNSSADFKQMGLDEFIANKNANVPNFLRDYVDVVEAVATYPNGFPFVEDAPIVRKSDHACGFLREQAHGGAWLASFNGGIPELIYPEDVDVMGAPDT
jgi:CRISPR-associated protein (TIGR03986 family)